MKSPAKSPQAGSTPPTTGTPRPKQGVAVHPEMRGRGPKPGAPNAGRPRDEWKAWVRSLIDSADTRAAIARILSDAGHPAFPRVLTWADERAYGKEAQALEGGLTLTVVRRDEQER